MTTADWPVLRSYDAHHLDRISLPLGGIGTGTVGLGGRGDLRDFELANRPAKGFRPGTAFFAVRAQAAGQEPLTELQRRRLRPGRNVGLIGFDDAVWAPVVDPPLSVVAQPAYEIGVQAPGSSSAASGGPAPSRRRPW